MTAVTRPDFVSDPDVIVKLLPVMVSVASIAASSPCFISPVYVPERSVCSCFVGSQRPLVAAAPLCRRGFFFEAALLVIVVAEFVWAATTALNVKSDTAKTSTSDTIIS